MTSTNVGKCWQILDAVAPIVSILGPDRNTGNFALQKPLNLAGLLQGPLHTGPTGAYTARHEGPVHFTSSANMAFWLSGDQKDGRGLSAFKHSRFG